MTQREWVARIRPRLAEELSGLTVEAGRTSSYTREVRDYEPPVGGKPLSLRGDETLEPFVIDLLVGESVRPAVWRARVALEVRIGVSPRDAVRDSQKAFLHKTVSPYLRYGILLVGSGGDSPELLVPDKGHFDFVLSLPGRELTPADFGSLAKLIRQEVGASRQLEELG